MSVRLCLEKGGWSLLFIILVLSAGCSEQLTGPQPELPGTPGASEESERLFQPAFTCNEQLDDNWIELRGEGFGPMVAKTLEDPTVRTPHIKFERSQTLDVRETGDTTEFTFEDDADKQRLRWFSQQKMEVLIDEELGLQPGIYDVTVTNPTDATGPSATVTKSQAFAVLPRPKVDSVEPELACDGDRTIDVKVNGGPFLQTPDGKLPETYVGEIEENMYSGEAVSAGICESFDTGPLGGWSICKQLTVSIPLGNYSPGLHDVWVKNRSPNPDRATGCESLPEEDDVQFRVLRRPIVDAAVWSRQITPLRRARG